MLKTGDIISCYTPFEWRRPTTYLAPAIRAFTGFKYTHTALVVECWGSTFVAEAYTSGVILRPVEEFPDGMVVSVQRPKQINEREVAVRALSRVSRTKYDISSLLMQAAFQITGKWHGSTNERKAAKKFYCSEFVAWVHGGIFKKWYMTTPGDIMGNTTDFHVIYTGPDFGILKQTEPTAI